MPVGNDETPTMRELFETAVSKSSSASSTELGLNLDLLDEGLEHALQQLRTTEEKLRASATVLVKEYNDVEAQYRGHMVALRVDAGKLQRRHRALGERYQNSSWKAKQIGKDLHAAESSRLRAEEALSLLGDFDRYDALARRVQTQLEDDADARGKSIVNLASNRSRQRMREALRAEMPELERLGGVPPRSSSSSSSSSPSSSSSS